MDGRGWRIGLAGVALVLHVFVLAALPPLGDTVAATPVLVRLEAPPVAPVPVAPAPVTPSVEQVTKSPMLSAAPVKTARHVAPPAAARAMAALPVQRIPTPPAAPSAPQAAVAPGPVAPIAVPVRLAGEGATGSGPVVPRGTPEPGGGSAGPAPKAAPRGSGAAGVSADGDGTDLRALLAGYSSGVSSRIRQHQNYPSSAEQAGHEGKVKVSFTLSADGRLLDASVAGSSGFSELDAAALAAVKSAAPFQRIPAELKRDSAKLSITLRFYLQ